MTLACTLCGAMIQGRIIGDNDPQLIGIDREAADYQSAVMELVHHVQHGHPQEFAIFAATSQTYLIHLIAKLGVSSDPTFNEKREQARKLVYWTLASEVKLSLKPSVHAFT